MNKRKYLEQEWIDLMMTAKALGLSVEEVQNFIRKKKVRSIPTIHRRTRTGQGRLTLK
ncbi:hypothetical protein JOD43_002234 [Pullulanibacillus pueri]|uniref:Sin domain-containing protein n=1 Tax=Pullulanibacillus pueri TaxID=1437324 RepID=A0A8J3ELR5_9BACL|nr:anti-repressor SinI family protein [Pullulanibacillus pueri]MBM7682061.1 hypothetical protein [Pullulanibacillus pueri]GGH80129.1 hypothetical protein GCM10007096_16080 [Pullulanibacillus pueri]